MNFLCNNTTPHCVEISIGDTAPEHVFKDCIISCHSDARSSVPFVALAVADSGILER